MKSNSELAHYQRLRARMMLRADSLNVNWARYYANLLDLGGVHSEQYLKNYFNDDNKKFNSEQLSIIYNDLENIKEVKTLTQCELQKEVLSFISEIGKLTTGMEKYLDVDNEITKIEASKLTPYTRKILFFAEELHIRLEETKAQGF